MKTQVSLKTYLGTILILLIIIFASVSFVRSAGETAISDKSFVSEASWIVGKDGSDTYMKNGNTGEIGESTNSSAIFRACKENFTANDYAGTIYVRKGTYQIDTAIPVGKRTKWIAENGVILNVTANVNCFEVDDWKAGMTYTSWAIEGFCIDMNGYDGNGIYASHAVGTTNTRNRIEEISIVNVNEGYSGIYMLDAMQYILSNAKIRTNGTGLKLGVDTNEVTHYGNANIEGLTILLEANNAIGVDISSGGVGDGYRACNLAQFDRLQVDGTTSLTGTIGLKVSMVNSSYTEGWLQFNQLNIEHCYTGVLFNNIAYVTIINPFISTSLDTPNIYGVRYENNTFNNVIIGGYIQVGVTAGVAYFDNSTHTSGTNLNMLIGTKLYTEHAGGMVFTLTDVSDAFLNNKPTRNSGVVVSCYNGTWVTHGLAGDPATTGSITLSLRGATAYNATFILRAPTVLQSNATHFQIEFTAWESVGWTIVPVTVVEAQTVYWDATYKP